LLAAMSFNHRSLTEPGVLAALLDLYDWTDGNEREANARRLRGVQKVSWQARDYPVGRSTLRGGELTLVIDEKHFPNQGDLCLFGLVLSRFLSAYATINSFVHLVFELSPSGRRLSWQPERGTRSIL
jgi:type VI secretion system protein ImpG